MPENDLEIQLRSMCVKIPLLQAIKDIPILAKMIKELCLKKPRRNKKQPTKIQVVGQLVELISNRTRLKKYAKFQYQIPWWIKELPLT